MSDRPTLQEQEEAFDAYKRAKIKADDTLTFGDAMDAKRAWWRFLHIFENLTAEPPKK